MPNPAQTPLTRRHVLAGAAGLALLLAGCSTGAPRAPEPVPRDPLADLLDEHVALATAYHDAIAAAPDDARLPALADNVAQHITALAGALAIAPPPVEPAPGAPSSSQAPYVADDPAPVVAGIRDHEAAIATHSSNLALSQKPERAPLLASIAVAHECAVEVLG